MAWTVAEMPPTIAASLAAKNDEPIHETPRMQTMATSPPRITLPASAFAGSGRKSSIMAPAAASIRIMMARLISTRPVLLPLAVTGSYSGRRSGKMPSSTTATRAARKIRQQPIAARVKGSGGGVGGDRRGLRRCRGRGGEPALILRVVGELGAAPGHARDAGQRGR